MIKIMVIVINSHLSLRSSVDTFIMNVEYSCLMPTVYDYTISLNGDAKFFGYVLATFSLVRMCVFIPIGWWADKRSFREVYCCTAAVGFIGCFIYGAAGALGSKWWLLIGRALTGLGASNTTLSRTYVSKCVEADEFTRILGVQVRHCKRIEAFGSERARGEKRATEKRPRSDREATEKRPRSDREATEKRPSS